MNKIQLLSLISLELIAMFAYSNTQADESDPVIPYYNGVAMYGNESYFVDYSVERIGLLNSKDCVAELAREPVLDNAQGSHFKYDHMLTHDYNPTLRWRCDSDIGLRQFQQLKTAYLTNKLVYVRYSTYSKYDHRNAEELLNHTPHHYSDGAYTPIGVIRRVDIYDHCCMYNINSGMTIEHEEDKDLPNDYNSLPDL